MIVVVVVVVVVVVHAAPGILGGKLCELIQDRVLENCFQVLGSSLKTPVNFQQDRPCVVQLYIVYKLRIMF